MTFHGVAVRPIILAAATLFMASSGRADVLTPIEVPPLSGKFNCTCDRAACGNGFVGGYNTYTERDIPADRMHWYLPASDLTTLAGGATAVYSSVSGWRCQRA